MNIFWNHTFKVAHPKDEMTEDSKYKLKCHLSSYSLSSVLSKM